MRWAKQLWLVALGRFMGWGEYLSLPRRYTRRAYLTNIPLPYFYSTP